MRKFAYKHTSKEQSSKQSSGSKTETTLILCGYSRERANFVRKYSFDNEVTSRKYIVFKLLPNKVTVKS